MTNKFIDKIKDKDLQEFITLVSSLIPNINIQELYSITAKASKSKDHYNVDENYAALLQKWYDSDRKDYSVYDDSLYLVDAWLSWRYYSRAQIRLLDRKKEILSEIVDLYNLDTIVDLGAGIGYSSIALEETLHPKKVIATQLEDTDQYKICKFLFRDRPNIELVQELTDIESADIVFASEYFEHFERPIDHLNEVLKLNPKVLIVGNSFGVPDAIGHFVDYYDADGEPQRGKKISRIFNDTLRSHGYTDKKIRFFNNLPAIFIREDCIK